MKNRATTILIGLLIAVFLALAGRCFYIQYYRDEHYQQLCIRQQEAVATIKPQRGVIMDCRGRVLAASSQIQTVFVEPRILPDVKDTSSKLGEILNMPAHLICKAITESNNPGFVKILVDADVNTAVKAVSYTHLRAHET